MYPTFFDAMTTRPDARYRAAERAGAVLFVTVLTAIAAQISIPLPFTPVPFTFQPLIVLVGARQRLLPVHPSGSGEAARRRGRDARTMALDGCHSPAGVNFLPTGSYGPVLRLAPARPKTSRYTNGG